METKEHIRSRILALRDGMPEEERRRKSRGIMERVTQLPVYTGAELLLTYRNYKSEAATEELIIWALREGKRVYCPKVHGKEMEFYRMDSLDELTGGYKGIPEPAGERERLLTGKEIAAHHCLMLMPGSAFDRERNRIGYGKGYYDRYLERYPLIPTAAVCFACQLVKKIPAQPYDKRPDRIVTEETVIE